MSVGGWVLGGNGRVTKWSMAVGCIVKVVWVACGEDRVAGVRGKGESGVWVEAMVV